MRHIKQIFWRYRKGWFISLSTLLLIGVVLFCFQDHAAAKGFFGLFDDTSDEALKILKRYDTYLIQGNALLFVLRGLGWLLVLVLERGVTLFSSSVLDILNIGNFAEAKGFTSLMKQLDSLEYFLLLLAILGLFFLMLMGKKVEFSQAASNLILSMIIVLALPVFTSTMLGVTTDIGNGLSKGDKGLNIGQKTVIQNTADLTILAEHNWIDPKKIEKKAEIPNIKYIRINQQITKPEQFGGDGVLGYNLDYLDGKEVAAKFDPDVGFGKRWAQDFIGEGYYRWHVNFITVIVTLAALNFVYILSGIRMGRLMIELAFNQGFAHYLAFADFRTMTRLKQVLFNIVGALCTIVAMFASFHIFSSFTNFIVDQDLKGISYLFAMIGAMWFVIDGPVMVQKVLGVDAGVQSAWGLIGGAMGVKAAGGAVSKLAELGAKGAGKAGAVAAFAGGAIAGGLANANDKLAEGLNQKKDPNGNDSEGDKNSTDTDDGLNSKNDREKSESQTNGAKGLSEADEDKGLSKAGDNDSDEEELAAFHSDIDDQAEGISAQEDRDTTDESPLDHTDNGENGLNQEKETGSDSQVDAKSEPETETLNDATQSKDTPSDASRPELKERGSNPSEKNTMTQPDNKQSLSDNGHVDQESTSKNNLGQKIKQKAGATKIGHAATKGYNMTRKTGLNKGDIHEE